MVFLNSILLGVITSAIHVVSGPDHIAAVTPLVFETKNKSWKIGLLWGLGHVLGMMIIGLLFLAFKNYIPLDKISGYSEMLVGFTLIFIGIWSFYRIFRHSKKTISPHIHKKDKEYVHIHKIEKKAIQHKHTNITLSFSFGVGILHGLAGVSHFILLFPVLSFSTKFDSIFYITGFALGTIVTMISYAFVIDKAKSYSNNVKNKIINLKTIRFIGGLFSVIVGLYWLYLSCN